MVKRIDLSKEALIKLYYDERLNSSQVGQKLGVSGGCVLRNLHRYGLKARDNKEKHISKEDTDLASQGLWRCWGCNEIKDKDKFTPVRRHWMGHDYLCRDCSTKRRQLWKRKYPWTNRAHDINRRAGVNFITGNDLQQIWDKYQGRCYYCQKQLDKTWGYKGFHFDHVQNGVHEKNNLVITCHRCNTLKSNATPEELMMIARKMIKHKGVIMWKNQPMI